MNLLSDPILTLSEGGRVSLAGLFAAMAGGRVRGFPALRPHQRPAWHMFLVQLGALALWTAGRADSPFPTDEAEWVSTLRRLTPDHPDGAPWRLVVEEPDKPAFMQAPVPNGSKLSAVATPDALDMLITARNHDLKQAVADQAELEDWIYALVSLQTCEGYGGSGKNGVARMNGGSSSRPMLGLAPTHDRDMSLDPSAWWTRDVRCVLAARAGDEKGVIGCPGGPALLWCIDWPEGKQLDVRDLDPWFIEICRRVRLVENEGRISALCGTSKAARIDAKAFNGNVGDPWVPVHKTDCKSLTLGIHGDFDYKTVCDLIFSGNWEIPLLARAGNGETGGMLLVTEAFARGNSKTEGFKSRTVVVPGKVVPFFTSDTTATLSKAQISEIEGFDKALRDALALMAAGGEKPHKGHYAHTRSARARFNRAADRLFFPSLWRRVEAGSNGGNAAFEAKFRFLSKLKKAAKTELDTALPAIPCSTIRRPKAEARARREFMRTLRNNDACRDLFDLEETGARV